MGRYRRAQFRPGEVNWDSGRGSGSQVRRPGQSGVDLAQFEKVADDPAVMRQIGCSTRGSRRMDGSQLDRTQLT